MKKIGILFGQENTFPQAFVDRINEKKVKGISAEQALVDEVFQGRSTNYAVLLDRISQDVPFYKAYLKNAALNGTAVMNNPFWWSADEKFFNNALATKLGVPVPKTYLLPSKEMPVGTSGNSFRNLKFPMDWGEIFKEIGFPAYMKPHSGGGWKSVYKVRDIEHLFDSYGETGELVMLLQEEIIFDSYFRCYCLGGNVVRVMQYEPRNPHHLRYVINGGPVEKKLLSTIEKYVVSLNQALGYDFNTVEFAVRDGIPYAIDFCNPAPDADLHSVGEENFEWIVENAANMAIERAQRHREGFDNLTWGTFIHNSSRGMLVSEKDLDTKIDDFTKTSTSTPKVSTPAPKVSTPTPKDSTSAPKVSTPAPKVSTPAPKVSTPAAKVSTPAPKVSTSAPKTTSESKEVKKNKSKKAPLPLRGRKPKVESTEIPVPGKRGRKPKSAVAEEKAAPAKRGPKPKATAAVKAALGKRGRKPKTVIGTKTSADSNTANSVSPSAQIETKTDQ